MRAINQLIQDGLCWEDAQPLADPSSKKNVMANGDDDGKVFWFPSIMDSAASKKQAAEDLALINNN